MNVCQLFDLSLINEGTGKATRDTDPIFLRTVCITIGFLELTELKGCSKTMAY